MIAAVFDCVTYVQAALSRKGPAFACLLLAEEQETLQDPRIRRKNSSVTDERVTRFIEWIANICQASPSPPVVFSYVRDPDDQQYVNLALAVRADFLVTRDKDLLDLMDDSDFCQKYPNLLIVAPTSFLAHVRAERSRQLGYE